MNKRKIFSLAVVVIMIAILSFSTLAWFNDSKSVTNEFHVATSDGTNTPESIFSVDLWETEEDGTKTDGLKFENIVPGGTYHKDPTVENTGAYKQWIRVIVTVTDAPAWIAILGEDYPLTNIFKGYDDNAWTLSHDPVLSGDTLTYVYYYNSVLEPEKTATLFTDVVIPGALTQDDLAKLEGSFNLTIKADAVQVDAIEATTAKEAFAYVGWPAGSDYPEN